VVASMKWMCCEGDDGGGEGDVVARKAPERIWVQKLDWDLGASQFPLSHVCFASLGQGKMGILASRDRRFPILVASCSRRFTQTGSRVDVLREAREQ
jgi:hypothetical protein